MRLYSEISGIIHTLKARFSGYWQVTYEIIVNQAFIPGHNAPMIGFQNIELST